MKLISLDEFSADCVCSCGLDGGPFIIWVVNETGTDDDDYDDDDDDETKSIITLQTYILRCGEDYSLGRRPRSPELLASTPI